MSARGSGLRVVLVDDEAVQREILSEILRDEGCAVRAFADARAALASVEAEETDLVLTDLRMPELDGLGLLERVHALRPDLPVLLMTAYGSVSSAVTAMKHGAFDYLQKPFERDELVARVRRVAERESLVRENRRLRRELVARATDPILGTSLVMRELLRRMERIADLEGDVLIAGESGTGKELVARALHYGGRRAAGPFVPVNCAAIPEGLAESELFGHEKGAFTHATSDRAGRFEQAEGGTLFLDEISAMPLPLQAKLLRVLQDRLVERVGSHRPRRVEVRIVAASNRDLPERIQEGAFREDLYHRLNVHELWIPPLRERGEDVILLAATFRDRAAARFGMPAPDLGDDLLDFLRAYPFPGNVRELEHAIEKMVALSDGDPLGLGDLPPSLRRARPHRDLGKAATAGQAAPRADSRPDGESGGFAEAAGGSADSGESGAGREGPERPATDVPHVRMRPIRPEDLLADGAVSLFDVERRLLEEAIRLSGGNLSEAARRLGISYKTMCYRARKFDLGDS